MMRIKKPTALASYRASSDVIAKGAFFLLTVLAARRLSGEAYGIFALGSTLGWIAGVVTDAGLQMHLARRVAQAEPQAGPLLVKWLPMRSAFAGAAFAIATAVTFAAVDHRTDAAGIVILLAAYLVNALVEFINYFYRGLGRSDIESTLTIASRLTALALGVGALVVWPSVVTLAVALLLPALATLGWSLRTAGALSGHPQWRAAGTAVDGDGRWRELVRDVFPLGAAAILSALYFRIDVFLIEWWRGTSDVGAYNAVFRLVEALRLFPAAVLAVALPWLCRATTGRDVARLALALAGLSTVGAAAVWLCADWIVTACYGSGYARAVPAFRVLLIAFPLMSLNYALTHQLIGWNRHRPYAVLCAAALLFNVGLNAQLIPRLALVGAAWTTVWTEVFLAAGCAALLWGGLPAPSSSSAERVTA